jgi:hypothetical protein
MSELEPGDKKAAYRGLIITAILLFLLSFTIVQLTNRKYAGEKGAHPETTK